MKYSQRFCLGFPTHIEMGNGDYYSLHFRRLSWRNHCELRPYYIRRWARDGEDGLPVRLLDGRVSRRLFIGDVPRGRIPENSVDRDFVWYGIVEEILETAARLRRDDE